MLAITELRIQLAALRTERDALLASLDARVTTTEVAVEDLRDKTAQVPAIDSNIGSIIETATNLRAELDQLSTTVSDAKIIISQRVSGELDEWRSKINKRSYLGAAFLAVSVVISEAIRYFV